jgi:hypothetical protein
MLEDKTKKDIYIKDGTGSHDFDFKFKTIIYPFDRFEIEVNLTENNEFIGISAININKEFLSHIKKMQLSEYMDVDQFYRE